MVEDRALRKEKLTSTTALIILILIIVLFAGGRYWGYSSRSYGGPGMLGLMAIVLIIMLLTGQIV
jgi:hypothetical protein